MSVKDVLKRGGPRKLLALDGGGIRGLISVEVLAEIERQLRGDRGDDFRLADEFDYIAGTSTGAIIATCLSLGMSVAQIRDFYRDSGTAMFDKASLLRRLRTKFEDEKLAGKLKEVLGQDTTLGTDELRTLLLIVMRNATTDSPWPLSNNPNAKYNLEQRRRDGLACNLDLPLWQLVRASTAAPTYFPPEAIQAGGPGAFLMVDGGVTMYNNPAFLVFLMATVEPYNLRWPTRQGRDARRVDRHRHEPEGQPRPRARGDEPHLQRELDPVGADVRRAQRAGLPVPRVRRLPDGDELDREVGDMIGTRGPRTPSSSRTSGTTPSSPPSGWAATAWATSTLAMSSARLHQPHGRTPGGRSQGRAAGPAGALREVPEDIGGAAAPSADARGRGA